MATGYTAEVRNACTLEAEAHTLETNKLRPWIPIFKAIKIWRVF
jgi:hypothetical protein